VDGAFSVRQFATFGAGLEIAPQFVLAGGCQIVLSFEEHEAIVLLAVSRPVIEQLKDVSGEAVDMLRPRIVPMDHATRSEVRRKEEARVLLRVLPAVPKDKDDDEQPCDHCAQRVDMGPKVLVFGAVTQSHVRFNRGGRRGQGSFGTSRPETETGRTLPGN
jgi:hypothetical protein